MLSIMPSSHLCAVGQVASSFSSLNCCLLCDWAHELSTVSSCLVWQFEQPCLPPRRKSF